MSEKIGKPYEILTQLIFQEILNQGYVENIKVEHDIILQGKTTKHQIDVFWIFKVGDVEYQTIVQAKDWANAVNQGELLKFREVLNDIPGQPKGIFVTKTGYQKGAKEVAENNGILLFELREPSEKDWEGRVKTIVLNITALTPHHTDLKILFDQAWVEEEREKLKLSEDEEIEISFGGFTDKVYIYDQYCKAIGTIYENIGKLRPIKQEELPPTRKKYTFDGPAFIKTGYDKFPKVKINGIEATISVTKIEEKVRIEFESIVGFILKNVLDEDEGINIFDKNIKFIKSTNLRKGES